MPPPDPAPSSRETILAIATRLADPMFGTGPLATLRRLDPAGALAAPALQRLLARHVVEQDPLRLRAWALLIHCMAIAAPEQHRGGEALGAALYQAGYQEGRLARLLKARGGEMLVAAPRLTRFLVARGQALDPTGLWRLIRPVLIDGACDTDRAEEARTRIARDYYRAEARAARAA